MRKICHAETADVFPGIIARNKAVLDYEKYIQKTFYPLIIHPYSRLRVYLELISVIVNPIQLVLFFFAWTFLDHCSTFYQCLTATTQMFRFVQLVLMFFTGYVEPKTEIVVLDPKRIARRYLFRSFIFDVISCIPFELIMFYYKRECVCISALSIKNSCHCVMFLTAAGYFCAVATASRFLSNSAKVFFWNPFLFNLISFTYYFFLGIIFNFAFLIIYKLYVERTITPEVNAWAEFVVFVRILLSFCFDTIFLNVIFMFTHTVTQIPILTVNFFFGIFCTVYFIKYTIGKMKARERLFFLENRVKSFAKKNNLPFVLRKKILLYFQILLKNKNHQEDEIFNYVPDTFKGDIFFHFCLPLLKGFYAFEEFPTYVLRRLAERLHYQLYLPNEFVILKRESIFSMYFIQKGTVALYSNKDIELYHFEAGTSISGRYFFEGKPLTNYYAISIEVTEVYRLDYEDFIEIMSAYPQLLAEMKSKFEAEKSRNYDAFES